MANSGCKVVAQRNLRWCLCPGFLHIESWNLMPIVMLLTSPGKGIGRAQEPHHSLGIPEAQTWHEHTMNIFTKYHVNNDTD